MRKRTLEREATSGLYRSAAPRLRTRVAARWIGAMATIGLLAVAAILASVRPWASDRSDVAHAFDSGEWRAILENSLNALGPGTGFTQSVETYSRHGAAAGLIRETSLSYTPETSVAETAATFDNSGAVESFTYRQVTPDGRVLREAMIDRREWLVLDHVVGTEERQPIPQAIASVVAVRRDLLRRNVGVVERFLNAPSGSAIDLLINETDSVIIVQYQTGLPSVSGGVDGWTVPYVADLDVVRAFQEHSFDKKTYQLLSSRHFAELRDGSQVTLERIVIGELKIVK